MWLNKEIQRAMKEKNESMWDISIDAVTARRYNTQFQEEMREMKIIEPKAEKGKWCPINKD